MTTTQTPQTQEQAKNPLRRSALLTLWWFVVLSASGWMLVNVYERQWRWVQVAVYAPSVPAELADIEVPVEAFLTDVGATLSAEFFGDLIQAIMQATDSATPVSATSSASATPTP